MVTSLRSASTNSGQAGSTAGVEFGTERWLFWANGGGQRAGDYSTPIGPMSETPSLVRVMCLLASAITRKKGFFSFNYQFDKRRYGIPIDPAEEDPEIVNLNPRRHSFQFNGGFREAQSFVEAGNFSVQYNDYTARRNKLSHQRNWHPLH